MDLRSLLRNFSSTNIELDPYERNPVIADKIDQSLVYLMARHVASEMWKMLTCDTDGRLLVSLSATQVTAGVNSAPVIANVSSVVLANNVNRRQYLMYNNGAQTVYLSFGVPATLATGFPLPVGGVFSDDQYVGAINGIVAAGTCELRCVEM